MAPACVSTRVTTPLPETAAVTGTSTQPAAEVEPAVATMGPKDGAVAKLERRLVPAARRSVHVETTRVLLVRVDPQDRRGDRRLKPAEREVQPGVQLGTAVEAHGGRSPVLRGRRPGIHVGVGIDREGQRGGCGNLRAPSNGDGLCRPVAGRVDGVDPVAVRGPGRQAGVDPRRGRGREVGHPGAVPVDPVAGDAAGVGRRRPRQADGRRARPACGDVRRCGGRGGVRRPGRGARGWARLGREQPVEVDRPHGVGVRRRGSQPGVEPCVGRCPEQRDGAAVTEDLVPADAGVVGRLGPLDRDRRLARGRRRHTARDGGRRARTRAVRDRGSSR